MPIERYERGEETQRGTDAELEAARHEARAAGRESARRVRGFLDRQRGEAAERVDGVAEALHRTARSLEDDGTSDLAERAARGAERLADILRERDVALLRRDAESFGREHPGALFGGAFAAGLVLSRFLKSSDARRREDGEPERDVPRPHVPASAPEGPRTTP